jgi:hypothetical protein
MRSSVAALAVLAVPLAVAGAAPAATPASTSATAWLHVHVEEPAKKTRVKVNLPLPVVEAALKMAPEAGIPGGRIHLGEDGFRFGGNHHLSTAELRQIWKELKAAGDTEIVNVEDEDGQVTVSRKGDLVQVRVQHEGQREEVHVDLPVSLVDALLSTDGGDLDVRAGIAELRKLRGDIVRVRDKETTVRIWIDESNTTRGGQ